MNDHKILGPNLKKCWTSEVKKVVNFTFFLLFIYSNEFLLKLCRLENLIKMLEATSQVKFPIFKHF